MNGRWHIYRRGERWQLAHIHMRIVIENEQYQAIGFRVPVARMHTEQSLDRDLRVAVAENICCARNSTPRRRWKG